MAGVVVPRALADILRQVEEGMLACEEAGQRILLMQGLVTEKQPSLNPVPIAPVPAEKNDLRQIAEGMHTPDEFSQRIIVLQGSATGSRSMNLSQKKLLTVAAVLLFAFLIYPPWDQEYIPADTTISFRRTPERLRTAFDGYHFVWSRTPFFAENHWLSCGRLIAQCFAVVVATGIGMVWLADQSSAASEKPDSNSE